MDQTPVHVLYTSVSEVCEPHTMKMQIDVKRYEPLTLSSRRILNCFSNSFLEFYSYEGF